MNAEEIIRHIEQLSEPEREKVWAYLREARGEQSASLREQSQPARRGKTFDAAADHVFSEHRELLRLLAQ
jgi:hypothetical protein